MKRGLSPDLNILVVLQVEVKGPNIHFQYYCNKHHKYNDYVPKSVSRGNIAIEPDDILAFT